MNGGTLGGFGTISGAITMGVRSGAGANLRPGYGASTPLKLAIQNALTFGQNTFQANYEGGDGNDLVLTVQ